LNNNEIRREILRSLFKNFRVGKTYVEGTNIVESIDCGKLDVYANLRYLDDKGLVNVIWRTGGISVANINSSGIDLLEDESEFNRKFPSSVTYDSSIKIGNVGGDIQGIGVSGSGNVIGKGIVINNSTYTNLEPQFSVSLEQFLSLINDHHHILSDENERSLKESIDSLAKLVEGLNPDKVLEDEEKRDEIKSEQITLANKVVKYLPKFAESIALATPLAPFNEVIGEGTGYFAEWIRKKLSKN
jgi:hypothetical protein